MRTSSTAASLAVLAITVLAGAAASAARHAPDASAVPSDAAEVRVESVRPERAKYVTLQFLKENRAFIRARFDRLRERRGSSRATGQDVDPRFLTYRELLAGALAAQDSVRAADEAGRRRAMFESADQLKDLENELDRMEKTLADQRGRLGVLERDFTGAQKTELVVVLSGWPAQVPVGEITIQLEDRVTITVPLDDAQRETLKRGGIVQVVHERVEPREQVIEVGLAGGAWLEPKSGFLTLDPAHDELTFLRLDLSSVRPDREAGGIQARTWHQNPRLSAREG